MVLKDWEINVVLLRKHEVVTNENSLFVIDEDYDVAIAINYLDNKLKLVMLTMALNLQLTHLTKYLS